MSQRPRHPIDVEIGARIRQHRLEARVTQKKLGELVGVTFQQVQKYENGRDRVTCRTIIEIADALDVPVATFFDGLQKR